VGLVNDCVAVGRPVGEQGIFADRFSVIGLRGAQGIFVDVNGLDPTDEQAGLAELVDAPVEFAFEVEIGVLQ
jgi:hypothetical protein